jgi:hypothetical protein
MKRVRFYDDNQDYLELHPSLEHIVETIWVPGIPIVTRSGSIINTGDAYVDFMRENGGWDLDGADRDLSNLLSSLREQNERIILSTGLNETHVRDLKRFASAISRLPGGGDTKGVVIFDWDEVLNQREGYRRVRGDHSPTAYMKYAMGTKTRMNEIRACIELLTRNKIEVHIATNNTGCGKSDFFESVAHALHPKIHVHCCRKYDTKSECISVEQMIPETILSSSVQFGRTRSKGMKHFRNVVEN